MAASSPRIRLAPVVVLLVAIAFGYVLNGQEGHDPEPSASVQGLGGLSARGSISVAQARAQRLSDVWVEFEGRVDRLLADDLEGSRHQRFIVEVAPDHTILVSHNIDLAARVPLEMGDRVRGRGEYVFDRRGGIVHWTHADPRGESAGGWIRHRGRHYD